MPTRNPLKYINRLPFPVTVKHNVSFGNAGKDLTNVLRSGNDWMELRNKHPRYKIADTRDEWLADLALDGKKDGQDEYLLARVDSLITLMRTRDLTTLYSVGSGGAVFEYFVKKRAPELTIIVTECTKEGFERLERVFTEGDGVELFDALSHTGWEHVAGMKNTLVFMYRNEREFTNAQWKKMFVDMNTAGVGHVFIGLMYTLTILGFIKRKIRNSKERKLGMVIAFAGYLRSLSALRSFWRNKYIEEKEIVFPTCTGLYLTRIQ